MRSFGVVAIAGLLLGCHEDQALVITRFVAVTSADCVASSLSPGLSRGTLDVGLVAAAGEGGYEAAPVFQNNFVDHSANDVSATDSIQTTGVNVELEPAPELAEALPNADRRFFVPGSAGLLLPGGTKDELGSSSPMIVELIPASVATKLAQVVQVGGGRPVVIAHVKPVGRHEDETLTGLAADFPIEICKFCLSAAPQACPKAGFASATIQKGGCFPHQDVQVTCCNASNGLLCGSAVPSM